MPKTKHAVHSNWGVENKLQKRLYVGLSEGASRIRQGHTDDNFAVLQPLVLSLLRQGNIAKIGIRVERLRSGWAKIIYSSSWPAPNDL